MSQGMFLDPLILRTYARGEWVLAADFRYQSGDGALHAVPKGFITDLASTPWLVKPLLQGIEDRASGVVHDWLYCENRLSRAVCDALFYEMLMVTGADLVRAQLMFTGLCISGWYRYSQCKGGVKVEDLALELMSDDEQSIWVGRLNLI